jgi:hypothetical protein
MPLGRLIALISNAHPCREKIRTVGGVVHRARTLGE